MSAPLVSVVIPSRDRTDLLRETVRANLAQEGVAIEVLVVDDGSAVPSAEALADIDDERLRVLRRTESGGVSRARNAGLAEARGTWVSFCDDDDLPAPWKLLAQLEALEAAPDAVWSCVDVVKVDPALRIVEGHVVPESGDVAAALLSHNIVPGGGSGVLARADVLRRLGGFDPELSMRADYDLWIRLALAGPLATVARPLLAYRLHDEAMSQGIDDAAHEVVYMDEKYAAARASYGVERFDGYSRIWFAERQQRARRRVPAARSYLAAFRYLGLPRALWRAGEALVAPGAHARREVRRLRRLDPAWLAEAELWLAPLRER